jgi:hypothetical protein
VIVIDAVIEEAVKVVELVVDVVELVFMVEEVVSKVLEQFPIGNKNLPKKV